MVVGAGSTGSVVASRLSEDPRVTVLLIEAGGDGTRLSNVPGLAPLNLNGKLDWAYRTKPNGRRCVAGKVSSACTS